MDIEVAKTFLEIVRCGSFIAAAERLHVTQTAITARIQKLENSLNSKLFVRNKTGAKLTADGEVFVLYANRLIQTWEAAVRDLPLPEGINKILHIGGEVSLYKPLILNWVRELNKNITSHAIKTKIGDSITLLHQLELGLLDAILVYQPTYWPGLQVELILEEKLILVSSTMKPAPYIYVDWGTRFRQLHDGALQEYASAALSFNLGPAALQYILNNGGSGYFRARVVQPYIDKGILERVSSAPEFSYPTYLVYSHTRPTDELNLAIKLLKQMIATDCDWS